MKNNYFFMSCHFPTILILSYLYLVAHAYTPLTDSFLLNITSGGSDFDPVSGALLSPLLTPRVPGTPSHSLIQSHFLNFFSTSLPEWDFEWYNSTTTTSSGSSIPISNLVFTREPPWTKPGQANWLTFAAHYDSMDTPKGYVGAADGAVPCAILMHVARSIDRYVSQMHDEMAALGEGGTVEMDMGVQIVFIDGKEALGGDDVGLYGSRALSETLETRKNPVGSKLPNELSQISMFVLLDALGTVDPTVPSYFLTTHWVYKNMANMEERFRGLGLLETSPIFNFLPVTDETTMEEEMTGDYVPFMDRGVPFLHLQPSPLPSNLHAMHDNSDNLDLSAVRDWAKIVTGFALEWLDMMEVWPE